MISSCLYLSTVCSHIMSSNFADSPAIVGEGLHGSDRLLDLILALCPFALPICPFEQVLLNHHVIHQGKCRAGLRQVWKLSAEASGVQGHQSGSTHL